MVILSSEQPPAYPPIKEKKSSFGSLTQLFGKKKSATPRDSVRDSKGSGSELHRSSPTLPNEHPSPLASSASVQMIPIVMSTSTPSPTTPPLTPSQSNFHQPSPPQQQAQQSPSVPHASSPPPIGVAGQVSASALPANLTTRPRKRSLSDLPPPLRQSGSPTQGYTKESPLTSSSELPPLSERDPSAEATTPTASPVTAEPPMSAHEIDTVEDEIKRAKRNSIPRAMKQFLAKGAHHSKKKSDKRGDDKKDERKEEKK